MRRPLATAAAAALDVAALLAFAAAGRRSHAEAAGPEEIVVTALPFAIGAATGWIVARAWRRPLDPRAGVVIWAVGTPLGLVLRRVVFDRGIAVPFVIVALVVTALLLVGWRLAAAAVRSRRTAG